MNQGAIPPGLASGDICLHINFSSLATVINGGEREAILRKQLMAIALEDLKVLFIIARGPHNLVDPLVLRIPDDVDCQSIAIWEGSWHREC